MSKSVYDIFDEASKARPHVLNLIDVQDITITSRHPGLYPFKIVLREDDKDGLSQELSQIFTFEEFKKVSKAMAAGVKDHKERLS